MYNFCWLYTLCLKFEEKNFFWTYHIIRIYIYFIYFNYGFFIYGLWFHLFAIYLYILYILMLYKSIFMFLLQFVLGCWKIFFLLQNSWSFLLRRKKKKTQQRYINFLSSKNKYLALMIQTPTIYLATTTPYLHHVAISGNNRGQTGLHQTKWS